MMKSSKIFGRKVLFLAISTLALGASGAAVAGTATQNLGVSTTVNDNCTISTTALSFASYDPIVTHASTDLDGTGAVTITCTLEADVTITLGQGANADTGSTDAAPLRRMISGGNYLSYSLFSDAAQEDVWGNTELTGLADTGTGEAEEHDVYGLVEAGQNVPAGSYADTVVATVTF